MSQLAPARTREDREPDRARERTDSEDTAPRPLVRAVPGLANGPQTIHRLVSVRGQTVAGPDGITPIVAATPAFDDDIEALIKAVDDKTQEAWGQIVNRPLFAGMGPLVASSGYLGRWVDGVGEALDQGYIGPMLSAQFGYAVETLTTYLLKNAAVGWALSYQIAAGNTRPDIVAKKGTRVVWLDLTSSGIMSNAHIYWSKKWDNPFVCGVPHAELTYPAAEPGVVKTVLANAQLERAGTPNPSAVDPNALTAQIQAAAQQQAANVARWRKKYVPLLKREARPRNEFEDMPNPDARAMNSVYRWMQDTFGTHYELIDERQTQTGARRRLPPKRTGQYDRPRGKSYSRGEEEKPMETARRLDKEKRERLSREDEAREVGSVLEALGVTAADYGFMQSYSRARGIAFLEEQDPA